MITKEDFAQKVKKFLKDKPEGILVAQIPQALLTKEQNSEMKTTYKITTWWKFLEQIDGIEIFGPDDSKKAILQFFANTDNSINAQPVKAASLTLPQKTEKTAPAITKKATINLSEKIKTLLTYLNQNLYGKDEAVRLALLSAVANESIFFMGPPGTAKSMISRRIAAAFKDFYKDGKFSTDGSGYFEYLMNEFSTPDEICGPVELSALNEKPSRYVRQTKGYLPSANVAFLDEIWKSGPAILNTLLTIINEKKFHNGNKVEKVPLVSLASASNELPPKDMGLLALWDRFILRVFVNPVESPEDFFKLVDDGNKELVLKDEYKDALLEIGDVENWQTEIDKIELSIEARNVITAIRQELVLLNADKNHKADDGEAYYVSDRRWKKIVHILKTSAFLNGRKAVDLMDCSLIEYAVWNTYKQHEEIGGIIEKILGQNGIGKTTAIGDITDKVNDFEIEVNEKWFIEKHQGATEEKPSVPKECEIEDYFDDDTKVFEIAKPECIYSDDTAYYIYCDFNDAQIILFDDKKYAIYNSRDTWDNPIRQLKMQGNTITWYDIENDEMYSVEIAMTKAVAASEGKIIFEPKVFNPDAKKTIVEAFDKEEYTPIVEQIDKEIKDLQDFRTENEKPFTENAFAKVSIYNPILLNKIDESIRKLEDIKCKLKEVHDRYDADDNIISEYKVGDCILKDGSYKKASEKAAAQDILAKVFEVNGKSFSCFAFESFPEMEYAEAQEFAKSYGKDTNPESYNSGWIIPSTAELSILCKNSNLLASDKNAEYWTSDPTKNGGYYYCDFSTGEFHATEPLVSKKCKVLLIKINK